MKKILNKIICLSMAGVLVLSGCGGGKGEENRFPVDNNTPPIKYIKEEPYDGGVHQINKTETDKYIIKDGASNYVIVIADNAKEKIVTASNELQSLLYEATGVFVNVVREADYDTNHKCISLGDTKIAETNNIAVDKTKVNTHGYVIKTVNDNIFIKSGGSDFGVIWGVYELLTQTVGYTCVAYDTYVFNKNTNDVKLYNFDIVDSPDFELRLASNGIIYTDSSKAQKLRFVLPHKDVYLSPSAPYHNYFTFIPNNATNKKEHPKWFSTDDSQLCLTAHGDEEEREALINAVVEKLKVVIDAEPEKKIVTFTQEDFNTWCQCDSCRALHDKYHTDSAAAILFINEVAERIEKWLDTERGGRDVLISIFAYHKTEVAPVTKNSDGTFSPIDDKVVLRDNVAVLYAPIFAKLTYGFNNPINAETLDIIKSWSAVCDHFGYWGYTTNYREYLTMYNSFSCCQSIYKTLLDNFIPVWIFDQGQHDNGNHTAFTHFKIYLNSQLQWDVNRDYNEIKKTFFDTYFGAASLVMQEFYEAYRTHMFSLQTMDNGNIGNGIFDNLRKGEYFPYRMLIGWMKYFDKAYEAIEVYKDNPELYKKMYDHINLESISVRYLLLRLYPGRGDNQQLKDDFIRDISYHNITNLQENVGMEGFIENLKKQ